MAASLHSGPNMTGEGKLPATLQTLAWSTRNVLQTAALCSSLSLLNIAGAWAVSNSPLGKSVHFGFLLLFLPFWVQITKSLCKSLLFLESPHGKFLQIYTYFQAVFSHYASFHKAISPIYRILNSHFPQYNTLLYAIFTIMSAFAHTLAQYMHFRGHYLGGQMHWKIWRHEDFEEWQCLSSHMVSENVN